MPELNCDLAVIGAGPAGLAAASRAAELGLHVIVLDQGPRAGGQIWRHRNSVELPRVAQQWLQRFQAARATLLTNATVSDWHDGRLLAEQQGQTVTVRAARTVLCVGARELFLPFPGWTLPGVVGVGGGQALLKSGMDVRGNRVVVAGSGPLLLPVAAAFAKRGAHVLRVVEQARLGTLIRFGAGLMTSPTKLLEGARYRAAFRSARFQTGAWISHAQGDAVVREVVVTDGRTTHRIACNLACIGYGLVPSTELAQLAGCAIGANGTGEVDALQQTSQAGVYCAGESTGIGGVDAALIEGQIAGLAAAGQAKAAQELFAQRARYKRFEQSLAKTFALRSELRALPEHSTVVCRCEDVGYGEFKTMSSLREAKLLTRAGMGPCQGRVCGAALQHLFGWSADTVRMPACASQVGTLAGQ